MKSTANDTQIGGDHYKKHGVNGEQHWDRAARLGLDYFQAAATKYIERCWDKNGIQDLKKAMHYIAKYIELSEAAGRKGVEEQRREREPVGVDYVTLRDLLVQKGRRGAGNIFEVLWQHVFGNPPRDEGAQPGAGYVDQARDERSIAVCTCLADLSSNEPHHASCPCAYHATSGVEGRPHKGILYRNVLCSDTSCWCYQYYRDKLCNCYPTVVSGVVVHQRTCPRHVDAVSPLMPRTQSG